MMDGIPHHIKINIEIVMNDAMPHAHDGVPRNLGMLIPEGLGKLPTGFSDDFQLTDDAILKETPLLEGFTIDPRHIAFNLGNSVEDMS